MKVDLTGKLAVVTGGSGELGRTIVESLAACGAEVAFTYFRQVEAARALLERCERTGAAVRAFQADVSSLESLTRLRDAIGSWRGAPSIAVNNAVVQYAWTSVLEQPLEDYQSQFNSCVLHNVLMAKVFVPAMIERRYGRVIGINTESAMQCLPRQSAYAAGKRGMDGVLRVLARELGPHQITVNQVAPGWTISERDRQTNSERQPEYERGVPLGRRGTDQDVANAVVFLASDLASFITGAFVPVCGGQVMPTI